MGDETHELILSELRDIKTNVAKVDIKIDGLKKQIYEGNGQTSLVDRINRNTIVTKVVVWCVGVLYIAVIGGIVGFIFKS